MQRASPKTVMILFDILCDYFCSNYSFPSEFQIVLLDLGPNCL